MRIWTKATYQFDPEKDSYVLVPEESTSLEYGGDVALAKGDSTASSTEQDQQQLDQQQQAYFQQLMSMMSTRFGNQQGVLQLLQQKMAPYLSGSQGYDAQTLASMRTSSDDNLSEQYQSAQKALNASEDANGSRDLPSGVNDQLDASLLNSEATDKASSQNQITQANANLGEQNLWNVLSGVASQDNPLGYASAEEGAATRSRKTRPSSRRMSCSF